MTKTLSHITKAALLAVIMLAAHVDAFAQIKLVTGFVYNKAQYDIDGNKIPIDPELVDPDGGNFYVYAFNNKNVAEDVKNRIIELRRTTGDASSALEDYDERAKIDKQGYFEIKVALGGALLVMPGISDPVTENVNGRTELEIGIDIGVTTETVIKTAPSREPKGFEVLAEQFGDNLNATPTGFNLPAFLFQSNTRVIMMPYLYNHTKKDTVHYRTPRIYDGEEFHRTQMRWQGYKEDKDTLMRYCHTMPDKPTNGQFVLTWNDTIVLPNTKDQFQLLGEVIVEDYQGIIYKKPDVELSKRNSTKPMRFLECPSQVYDLDPMEFRLRARKERVDDFKDLGLTFVVGSADIDMDNPENVKILEELRSTFRGFEQDASVTFKQLSMSSVSSPDGTLAANKALAQRRLASARKIITQMLSPATLRNVYIETSTDSAKVATWEDVAVLLERDSLVYEASSIREIIAKYQSQDLQSARIRNLACYDTIRTAYLPKLRKMTCYWTVNIMRELTPKEILDKYNENPDYEFVGYEYWTLFQTVKDSVALEKLYRKAYEASPKWGWTEGRPWELAANNLAASYIRRDTVDLSILAPFIDEKAMGINIKRSKGMYNREEMVANQAIMYMMLDNGSKAGTLAYKLRSIEKYRNMTDIMLCLSGYYNKNRQLFNRVKNNTTPLNHVVMCLADKRGSKEMNAKEALEVLDKMPDTWEDPKLLFLRAVANSRLGDAYFNDALQSLILCFTYGGQEWIDIAKGDGAIDEGLIESTGF